MWILRCPLCQEIVESHTTGIQGWNILETGITVRVIKAHHVVKRISEYAEDQKFSSWYYVKNPGKSLLEVNKWKMLVETCLFGVVNLTRAALPVMRRQRSGHIIQISSLGGRTAFPGNAAYFASKWAVGGFTESLALETAPFGVKVTALEPGAMRTNWGKRAHAAREPLLPEY